jgi:hypothetical protein
MPLDSTWEQQAGVVPRSTRLALLVCLDIVSERARMFQKALSTFAQQPLVAPMPVQSDQADASKCTVPSRPVSIPQQPAAYAR